MLTCPAVVPSSLVFIAAKWSLDSSHTKPTLPEPPLFTMKPESTLPTVAPDDNNISGTDNFAKITFIYPPRETPTATTEFVSERAFVQFDMSTELLSIVRRSNKQAIESEGTGVVITRLVE